MVPSNGSKGGRKKKEELQGHESSLVNDGFEKPRICALGTGAYERGPVMITKIHAYLVKEVNLAENAEEKSAEFVNRVCQVTLEAFWTQNVKGEEGFDRTDSMLEGLGAGWSASFLVKVYPSLSRYRIKEFLQAIVEVSIVELLALFVTFGAENFVRGPVILPTEGVQNFRLDGLLTLIAIAHGNLGGFLDQDKRSATYFYRIPPAAESLWNRRG